MKDNDTRTMESPPEAASISMERSAALPAETVARLKAGFAEGALADFLGLKAEIIETDRVVLRMACKAPVMNSNGTINGGAMASLLDNASAAAAWATPAAKATTMGTTVALTANYIGRPRQGDAIADARVISRGGTLVVIEVACHDEGGYLLAKAQVTYKLDLARDLRLATARSLGPEPDDRC